MVSVPLLVYTDSLNRVNQIQLLDNNETPEFIDAVKKQGIIKQWIGKNLSDVDDFKPDAVSGATITSNAINRSVVKSLEAIANGNVSKQKWYMLWNFKTIIALLVVMSGAFMSFYTLKRKQLRIIQLLLNTLVLGAWCGQFISIKALQTWASNGANLISGSFVVLTLLLVVIMPLVFNKKAFYCTWVCPLGSAQELLGKLNKKKVTIPQMLMRYLKYSQSVITLSMLFLLWIGLASSIAEYEPFSVFIFQHASWGVITIAGLSLFTSLFINRPWCRFACPTGQILSWVHKIN